MKKILSRSSRVAASFLFFAAATAHAENAAELSESALSQEPVAALLAATPSIGNPSAPAFFKEEATPEAGDVWNRIRSGFALSSLDGNPLVARQAAAFSADAARFEGLTKRSSPYLYHLVQELEKRSMPLELALLPFVESSFNPLAVSSAKAAGMWQFMPATGKHYKLAKSVFQDERRGVIASTDAALTYLQYLHEFFGDWQLALAAYNWGEGNVAKAIKKNERAGKGRSFNELSHLMPAETRAYVPKLMAFKDIIESPEKYGVNLAPVANKPYFTAVTESRDIDVAVAAKLAELPMKEFKALNPQFDKPVIPGGPESQILLPAANADKFKANLSQWTQSLSSWTSHKVTAAYEKIEAVAARFQTSPALIREVNNIPPRMNVRAGSTLLVPRIAARSGQEIEAGLAQTATLLMSPQRVKKAKSKSRRYPSRSKS